MDDLGVPVLFQIQSPLSCGFYVQNSSLYHLFPEFTKNKFTFPNFTYTCSTWGQGGILFLLSNNPTSTIKIWNKPTPMNIEANRQTGYSAGSTSFYCVSLFLAGCTEIIWNYILWFSVEKYKSLNPCGSDKPFSAKLSFLHPKKYDFPYALYPACWKGKLGIEEF